MRIAPQIWVSLCLAWVVVPAPGLAGSVAETAIADLERSGATVTRRASGELGAFVRARDGIAVSAGRAAGADGRARAFLDRYGAAFGVSGAAATRLVRRGAVDAVGMEHVRVQQQHGGVPVAGGELTIHLRGGAVTAVLARTVGDLDGIDTAPAIDAAAAEAAVRAIAAGWDDGLGAVFGTPRLELFNAALLTGAGSSATRLAWFVEARTDGRDQYTWVDAHDGEVLYSFDQQPSALVRQVWDAANSGVATLARQEGDPPTGNGEVDAAYDFSGDVYDYFATRHGRDGYDGAGGTMMSVVRACPGASCFGLCPCPNAFNALTAAYFGDGWVVDDIVAHEWTHSVTGFTAGLLYQKQSGGLNESFSDIFGESIDLQNGAGTDTAGVRWLIGEDLNGTGIRDMANPNAFGSPGRVGDGLVYCGTLDNGGVHINSGIPNHAYALMVDGGSYNGYAIAGVGLAKADQLQYRALAHYLVASATLADAANALNQSCYDLLGTAGITIGDCNEIGKAIDAVEMDAPWPCPTDPPTPTPTATTTASATPTIPTATATATATITPTATATPTSELACPAAPRAACRGAGRASLLWKRSDGAGDRLIVKWTRGQSTSVAELADPTASASYALCLYGGGALLGALAVPPDAAHWHRLGKGYAYKDSSAAANGVTKVLLKSGTADNARILFKGAGAALPDPPPGALATPLQMQVANLQTSVCWEAAFAGADVSANDADLLKARASE